MDVLSSITGKSGSFRYGPWIMQQRWHNLLFAHWRVDPAALRPAVPSELAIDTFNGRAWLGIVAFRLSGVKLRGLPEVPQVASFPEVNVRTYVTYNGRPGVYFLSLDADNPLAIALARPWFRLNYYNSEIGFHEAGDCVEFRSRRIERGAPQAELGIEYQPLACEEVFRTGPLEHWLTDRFSYYVVPGHRVMRCDIEHAPWPLQPASACFDENSMAQAHGIELPSVRPLLHYARYMEAHVWPLRRVSQPISNASVLLPSKT